MDIQTDGEGFLLNRDLWTPEIAREIASRDGREITDEIMGYIMSAREMFERDNTVPAIRNFTKAMGVDKKQLFNVFETGPMKLICKWGGLPKPTGCV
ncbi:TusE/DsrC/DsvC family sulfur relay protein [Magnetovibrio blakemorei]|uniref:TusE/DsrC/DsvC family sulfurtransferase n=1 Tax=Magnetovibrio blakemorei TaxID=28181 RepID=A0A1E5Q5Y0_9PROT|nr:TusE/DsrC/DsvC family sulfur relay protein [Magnetovibrio blakemorei]OEJ65958.1 TusE/DsrC/DsvC family sulfurtransferase [Magnetovibrio blakemorei]